MKLLFKILLGLMFLLPIELMAKTIKVTAYGKATYTGEFNEMVKDEALENAKLNAIKKATKKFPKSKKKIIRNISDFYDSPDDYIKDIKIQREKNNTKMKVYKVGIIAQVDLDEMDVVIEVAAKSSNADVEDKSSFGALILVTNEIDRQEIKDRVVEIKSNESQQIAEEKGGATGTSAISSQSQKSMSVKESGGSVKRRRDAVTYEFDATASNEALTDFSEKLDAIGIELNDIGDILEDLPGFEGEIEDVEDLEKHVRKKSGTLPNKLVKRMRQAAAESEWTLFGLGMIKMGETRKSKTSSMLKTSAIVSFKIWRLNEEGKGKVIVSVKRTPAYGSAETEDVSRQVAQEKAIEKAMEVITSKFQEKGLI
ncbi:hypothetical protein N9O69_05170 [Alphaproteobacteria bacterium]|nr:hypothetical protein [Alphaproteobacteria bacterium]